MADHTNPADHVEEVIHLAPRRAEAGTSPVIDGDLLMAMEAKLNDALKLAGDTAPRLMYQLANASPTSLDAFVRHHAEHFERRTIHGGEQVEVAAVLIRHAFIVGALSTQAVQAATR